MKNFITLLLFLFVFATASMQAQTSVAPGAWEAGATWSTGVPPTSTGTVVIGHAVTLAGTPIAQLTVTNAALTSNTATITTSAAHGLLVGQSVTLASVSLNAIFNGTYTISSVPSTTTFSYSKTNANITSAASSGTVDGSKATFSGSLTFNSGGTLAVNSGSVLAFTGGTTIGITRTDGSATSPISGAISLCSVSTDVLTVTINSNTTSGIETNSGSGVNGKIHLNVASGATYTLSGNRQVDNLDLLGTITDNGAVTARLLTVRGNITGTGSMTGSHANTGLITQFGSGGRTISAVSLKNLRMAAISASSGATWTLTGNLTITDSLSFSIQPTGSLNLLNLSSFNLTVGKIGVWPLATTGRNFVRADGTGTLTVKNVSTTPILFPVGTGTSYEPFTMKTTNTVDVSVKISTVLSGTPLDATKAATRQWDITPSASTGACAFTFTPSVLPSAGTYTTSPALGHYNGSTWEEFKYLTYSSGTWSMSQYNGTFSPFAVGGEGAFSSTVLAAELNNLKATQKAATNLISWSTASEKDNASFTIERSANGQDFAAIGSVKGQGNSTSQKNYTFSDETPLSISYYRVKSVDYTGAESTSKIVSVQRGKAATLKVYPSPVSDVLTVDMEAADNATFTVVDIAGRTMLRQAAANQINVNTLPKGLYFLNVEAAGLKTTVKFVKE